MINRDFRELFAAFVARDVRFLVVGGYAVAFHGYPRFTKDIDVLVARDAENAGRVFAALADFGAPLDDLDVSDFLDPENVFQVGVPPNRIDVLTDVMGVEFEAAWTTRVASEYDGVSIAFLDLESLLRAKRASGRPQDLLDADELERRRP